MFDLLLEVAAFVFTDRFALGLVVGAVIGGPALLKVWQAAFAWAKARLG